MVLWRTRACCAMRRQLGSGRMCLAPSPCKSLGRPIPVAAARVGGGRGRGPSQASSVASMLFASAVKTLAEAGKRPRMLP